MFRVSVNFCTTVYVLTDRQHCPRVEDKTKETKEW